MKTLVVVRHAKSDWSGGFPDAERPLAPRGNRQAADSAAWLVAHEPGLELALVSPAERTRATWAIIAKQYNPAPPVRIEDELYFGEIDMAVAAIPDHLKTVAIVAHNPDVEALVSRLTGQYVSMPTSCIAVIRWDGAWSDGYGRATLTAHGRPPA